MARVPLTSALLVSLILAVTTIIVTGAPTQNANNSIRKEICARVAQTCKGDNQIKSMAKDLKENQADIDRACEMASTARRCLGPCEDVLLGATPTGRALLRVVDHVCYERPRDEVKRVAMTTCFIDGTLDLWLDVGASQECMANVTSLTDEAMDEAFGNGTPLMESLVCPMVGDIMSCVYSKVGELCGDAVVPFFGDIFTIVFQELMGADLPSCTEQIKVGTSVLEKAVQYIRMVRRK